jgi:hypothetical protein
MKTLRIDGRTWTVVARKRIVHKGKQVGGLCEPANQRILYIDTAHPEIQRRTILHEALHALLIDTSHYNDETLIVRLEQGLDAMLADNPEFTNLY